MLAAPAVGDVLVTPATGAYGYAMANNYNGVPRPPVIFCRDGEARVVVRRETWDDLLAAGRVMTEPVANVGLLGQRDRRAALRDAARASAPTRSRRPPAGDPRSPACCAASEGDFERDPRGRATSSSS